MSIDVGLVGHKVAEACPDIEIDVVRNSAMSRVDCWGRAYGRKTYFGGVQADGWLRATQVDSPERRAVVRALLAAVEEQTP